MNTQQIDRDTRFAKMIEAGLLAQEALDGGTPPLGATIEELRMLVEEGRRAKDDLVLAHLGLVTVIAAEVAKLRRVPFSDLFQEGCLALQQAVMSYDWRKGTFGPYAGMWIRAAVRRVSARSWVPLDEVDAEDLDVTRWYERSLTHTGLAQMMDLIPRGQSDVLRLRSGWDGRPLARAQIASQLGLSVSKVRRLESAGLAAVRQHWEVAEAA